MILRDWQEVPADALAEVYASERERWLRALRWDSAAAWQEVEHARTAWGLPGFVVTDDGGRLAGVAYYLIEDGRLDIGGLASDDGAATDLLLDGILSAARDAGSGLVRGLLFDAAAALPSALRGRGFDVRRHIYLSRCLTADATAATSPAVRLWSRLVERPRSGGEIAAAADIWRTSDVDAAAALLGRAYDVEAGRLFAPNGDAGEWVRYVGNLVGHVGCGTVNPSMSQVVRDGEDMLALALVSDIGPGTAHLAQLVVDRRLRGERLGEALVARACQQLQAAGYSTLTLLVDEGNAPARALYDRAGFRHDATFLAGALALPDARTARRSATLATAS
jgi:ribosomal protein S18 acetylase RimI-like enzyme